MLKFELLQTDGNARLGKLHLQHGVIETPIFMPVGTYGAVKSLSPQELLDNNAQIILGNTFHLWLRPGLDVISRFGGLHKFNGWNKPILTDSGGFQVFSLGKLRKIKEEGVYFQNPIDGSKLFLSPEKSMEIQTGLNSDIVMIFDECTPYPATHAEARLSMEMSLRWARRSRDAFNLANNPNALFGIIQGGLYKDLRKRSLEGLMEIGFDGMAVGGLSVGEPKDEMNEMLDYLKDELPKDKPHYLMGVGMPQDILGAVKRGIDMFDCVLPTRSGRTGLAFTWNGRVNIRNAKYAKDEDPLDKSIDCPASNSYSKNYLNHLVNSNEILGSMLLTWHNIAFYQDLMKKIRQAIKENKFEEFYKKHFELFNEVN